MERHTVYELFATACICGSSPSHFTETGAVICLGEDGVDGLFGKERCYIYIYIYIYTYITAVMMMMIIIIISPIFVSLRNSLTAE